MKLLVQLRRFFGLGDKAAPLILSARLQPYKGEEIPTPHTFISHLDSKIQTLAYSSLNISTSTTCFHAIILGSRQ